MHTSSSTCMCVVFGQIILKEEIGYYNKVTTTTIPSSLTGMSAVCSEVVLHWGCLRRWPCPGSRQWILSSMYYISCVADASRKLKCVCLDRYPVPPMFWQEEAFVSDPYCAAGIHYWSVNECSIPWQKHRNHCKLFLYAYGVYASGCSFCVWVYYLPKDRILVESLGVWHRTSVEHANRSRGQELRWGSRIGSRWNISCLADTRKVCKVPRPYVHT